MIEAPRSKLRGIFDRKDFLSVFDSLANPAISPPAILIGGTFGGNALAIAVQIEIQKSNRVDNERHFIRMC